MPALLEASRNGQPDWDEAAVEKKKDLASDEEVVGLFNQIAPPPTARSQVSNLFYHHTVYCLSKRITANRLAAYRSCGTCGKPLIQQC